jgi:diadenosine tetraphosphatase ApaH/serine/threonine PP2A family protein phosphatase
VRYLILSDIHANIDALEAVLDAAPPDGWDRAIVLGDLVGYGAEPAAVIERVRSLNPLATIRGNHDKAACGIEDGSSFNYVARLAAQWTFEALSPEHRAHLRALPQGPISIDDAIEICHGAPFDEDHYIFDADDASRALDSVARPLCLFGHTHLPVVFRRNPRLFDGFVPDGPNDSRVEIEPGLNYLINVGSVGQPRDGDPRAAFGIYDSAGPSMLIRRVEYPVQTAQRRILDAGLPASLANRLGIGR